MEPGDLITTSHLKAVKITEKAFQAQVRHLAIVRGFKFYHTWDSRRSDKGFPDCVMTKGSRLVVAELKVGKNKPTTEQKEWLEAFEAVGAEVYVWYPHHLDDDILRVLS